MNIFIIAGIIAFTFFVIKFVEMKFVLKEEKPMKLLMKDTMYVFAAVVVGNYLMEQLTPSIDLASEAKERILKPQVFLGNPDF
jgi:hypothetical protein